MTCLLHRATRLLSVVLTLALPAAVQAQSAPGFSAAFSPDTIDSGTESTLTFTIDNSSSGTPADSLAFSGTLPAGVTIGSASSSDGCSGTLTASAGGSTITYADGRLGSSSSCTVSVPVASSTTGTHSFTSGDLTSSLGNSGTASDDLTVTAASSANYAKSASLTALDPGSTTALTYSFDVVIPASPSFNDWTTPVFTETLPAGLELATPPNASHSCDAGSGAAALTAEAGGSSISFTGPTYQAEGTFSCTVNATVKAVDAGSYTLSNELQYRNVFGSVTSAGSASVDLTVNGTPAGGISLFKAFGVNQASAGDTVTLEFSLQNGSRDDSATGIAFTDDLDAFLSGTTFSSLNSDSCGGSLSGSSTLSYSGGSLASGASCAVSVELALPAGAAAGTYTNTTSALTATDFGGSAYTGSTASTTLRILADGGLPATIAKAFTDGPAQPGGTVTARYTLSNPNTALAASDIAFSEPLDTPGGIAVSSGTGSNLCGSGSILYTADVSGTTNLLLTGGSLAAGASCDIDVVYQVADGTAPGDYATATSAVTATVNGGSVSSTSGASATLTVEGGANLSLVKAFGSDTAQGGGTAALTFTISSGAESASTATAIAFTDDLDAFLSGTTLSSLTSNSCGGSLSGTSTLSYTGGSLDPGGSCTVAVEIALPSGSPGTYTNTTSSLTATAGGEATTAAAASDTLQVLEAAALITAKSFSPASTLPGETMTLTYTLENPDSSFTYSSLYFTDSYSTALSSLAASSTASFSTGCGGSPAYSGTTTGIFTGIEIAPGETCTIGLDLTVPAGAADGDYSSLTSSITATVNSGSVALSAISANFSVSTTDLLELAKSYSSSTVAAGGAVDVQYTVTNLSSSYDVSALAFSDSFDSDMVVAAAPNASTTCTGGTLTAAAGSGSISYSGGSLSQGSSCTVSVSLTAPTSEGSYSGDTSEVTGTASSASVTGTAASATLTVQSANPPAFSKSFAASALAAGGSTTLTYQISNPAGGSSLSGLRFSDDLDAMLSGLAVTAGTGSDLCGSGSSVSGSSTVLLTGGSLAAGESCSIELTVSVPAAAATGSYSGSTSDLTENGSFAAAAASAAFSVEPAPDFAKAFGDAAIVQGGTTTLTFTVDNSASAIAASSLDFTDSLPAGMVVAPVPNASATCTGGTLTATAGSGSISYSGGTVAAGASCTVSADVRATSTGTLSNTSGALTSSSGSSGTASDSLTVSAAPVPGFAKSFAAASAPLNGSITMTLAIDNSSALIEASALDVTDSLPAGMVVASPANASATCTGGTLTAAAGSSTVSYSGGTVAAASSCTVTVDVTPTATGTLVNTTGSLTSSLGTSGTAQATLTVPALSLASPIATDDVVNASEAATLSLSGTTEQIEDGQSVSVTVTDGSSATASGSATVASGAWSLSLDVSSLADGSLTVTADASDAAGSAAPQASAAISKDATAPTGYSAAFDQAAANAANENAISFTFADAETGAAYSYSISSSGGGADVTGSGTIASAADQITGLDLSGLASGTLTLTVTLTDSAGNAGAAATDTIAKDTTAPSLAFDSPLAGDDVVNASEAASLTLSGTAGDIEDGQSVSVTVTDSSSATASGSATVAGGAWSLSLDVSALADGSLDLSADASDAAGNAAPQASATLSKDAGQPSAALSGPDSAQSEPFQVTLAFSEDVTGFALSGLTLDNGAASDLSGSGASYSFTVTPDHDGTVTITAEAGAAADASGNASTASAALEVTAALTGTPDPSPEADSDGDGIPDSYESSTADRDGDGIPDAEDYDPQGYFYCEDDGRILTGGSITVTGPSGSNSSVGISNDINIVRDGSSGEYQWFALRPGTYTVSYGYPSDGGAASSARLSSGSLDVTSLLPDNPAVIGSTEVGSTGYLADASLSANPAFYDTFVIEAGDPNVLANNIPMTQCSENAVTVSAVQNGAEANGGTPEAAVFTVSLARAAAVDTVISYTLAGTATGGDDYTAPSGTVTIAAGGTEAEVEAPVLDDTIVEGGETIELTLTAVTAGDQGTVLSSTASELTGSATITDDDFAAIAVTNDDLTASENGDDTAAMSFSLSGAPLADVVLSFSGDSQCTVSPSRMTFTPGNFATARTLTIRAIDDEDVEGTHSCQPSVAVSSADTSFDGYALALAEVQVADDLVDQIREQLTEVLKRDLETTVKTQQRYFSRLSKGALDRLQAGREDLRCGTIRAFDADGNVQVQDGNGSSDGSFGWESYNCNRGSREILDGAFSISHTDGLGTQAMLQVSRQSERFLSEQDLRGHFWGGYVSRTSVQDLADGAVTGFGLNTGIYGARSLSGGLFLDYYAAAALGHHRFDLDFAADAAPIRAEGDYQYAAGFAGAALSGSRSYDSMTVSPRVGLDLAYAAASDADVTATQLSQSDTGSISIPDYNGARLFAELEFAGLKAPEGSTPPGATLTHLSFAPRFACELSSFSGGSSETGCGFGFAFSQEMLNLSRGLSFGLELDYEHIDGSDRLSLGVTRERRFASGQGAVVTRLTAPSAGSLAVEHGIRLDF
ncbi:DUF11 domain-containing protein [Leisingera aquaemixtae]|uniref:DUF7933 domain-containing protein n=1 Tax=Leisingera aquaemixtae TaxID=1396826 RepID=UPI001C978712|nr:Ig-like domain-containing protein [Leisingera aquaemixtae]MBY6069020.1 DUF11 domain-containing protein [Leisingera aquaemixtae]